MRRSASQRTIKAPCGPGKTCPARIITLTPAEAQSIGLITGSFKKDEFHAKVQEFADIMSKRLSVAVEGTKRAVHDGFETNFRHALSIEMEQTIKCFSTPSTKRALEEYAAFLREKVEVPKESRASINDVTAYMQSDEFLKKINK